MNKRGGIPLQIRVHIAQSPCDFYVKSWTHLQSSIWHRNYFALFTFLIYNEIIA